MTRPIAAPAARHQPVRARHVRAAALLAGVLALMLTGAGCAYYNTFYHARKFYSQAQDLERKSRELPSGAQAAAQNVNQAQPQNTRAADLYKKTIDKCEKVIEKYPGSKWQDDAHLLLAKAYFGRRDYLSARKELRQFETRFPESDLLPEALHWLGLTAFAQEDYGEARQTWTDLLGRYPKFDDREAVDYHLALSFAEEDRAAEAEAAFRAYLEQHGKGEFAAQARLELGNLLLEDRRYQDAEEVFTRVAEKGKKEVDRLDAQLRLGEVLERQGRFDDALELYRRAALTLDPEVYKGRMTAAEREEKRLAELAAIAARQDSLRNAGGSSLPGQTAAARVAPDPRQKRRNPENLRDKQVARVMLREGVVMSRLNRAWDAILAFEQVIDEFPRSAFASEAQYRIGYVHEVLLEDLDGAQAAYDKVATQGRSSFNEDAQRRSKNLNTVKDLLATAAGDSLSSAESAAAEARFMRAELYLFQQEKPERAMEEYEAIRVEFPGTEFAAKAALANAWVMTHTLKDSVGGKELYAQVAADYPDTEYGRRASRLLYGPEPEPQPHEFAGPTLAELVVPENLAAISAGRDSLENAPTGSPASTPPSNPVAADPLRAQAPDSTSAGRPRGGQVPRRITPPDAAKELVDAQTDSTPAAPTEAGGLPGTPPAQTVPPTTPVEKPPVDPPARNTTVATSPRPAADLDSTAVQPPPIAVEPNPVPEERPPVKTPPVEPVPDPVPEERPSVKTPPAEPSAPERETTPASTQEESSPLTIRPLPKEQTPPPPPPPVVAEAQPKAQTPASTGTTPSVRVRSSQEASRPVELDPNPERLPLGPLGGKLNPWAVPTDGPTPVLDKKSFRSKRVTGKNRPSALQNQRTGKETSPN